MGDIKIKDRANLTAVEFTEFPEAGKCKKNNPDSQACNGKKGYAKGVKDWWSDNRTTLSKYVEGDINTVEACIKPTAASLGNRVRPWNDDVLQKVRDSLTGCKTALLAVQDGQQPQPPIVPPPVQPQTSVAVALEPVPDITLNTLGSLFWSEMMIRFNGDRSKAGNPIDVTGMSHADGVAALQQYVLKQFNTLGAFSTVPLSAGATRSAYELAGEINALPPTYEGWVAEAQKRLQAWNYRNFDYNLEFIPTIQNAKNSDNPSDFQWYYEELILKVKNKREAHVNNVQGNNIAFLAQSSNNQFRPFPKWNDKTPPAANWAAFVNWASAQAALNGQDLNAFLKDIGLTPEKYLSIGLAIAGASPADAKKLFEEATIGVVAEDKLPPDVDPRNIIPAKYGELIGQVKGALIALGKTEEDAEDAISDWLVDFDDKLPDGSPGLKSCSEMLTALNKVVGYLNGKLQASGSSVVLTLSAQFENGQKYLDYYKRQLQQWCDANGGCVKKQ